MSLELIECLTPNELAEAVKYWSFASWVMYKYDGRVPRVYTQPTDFKSFDNLEALGLISGSVKCPVLTPKGYYYSLRVHAYERNTSRFRKQYRTQDNWERMLNELRS